MISFSEVFFQFFKVQKSRYPFRTFRKFGYAIHELAELISFLGRPYRARAASASSSLSRFVR